MYISSKAEYGVRALFELAQQYGSGPVQSETIATRQRIPVNYLNQVLIQLRKAGLVESIRGPQGGHMLAHPPEQITLLEILTVLEGPVITTSEASGETIAASSIDREVLAEVWNQLRTTIEGLLESITLHELCQRKSRCSGQMMYHI